MNISIYSNHGGMPWVKNTEFNHVLGYTRYIVNRQGDLFDLLENRVKTFYRDKNGYNMTQLRNDKGERKIVGKHRILMLAFISPPDNPDLLDVNHLNGVPGDDYLDNLEWASRSENCYHAYRTGLRLDQKKVILRDIYGNIKEYQSFSNAARDLGVEQTTITNRCRCPNKLYDGFYFSSPDILNDKEKNLWVNYPVELLDIENENIIYFKNIKDLYVKFPSLKKYARHRLLMDSLIPIENMIIRSTNSSKKFPTITKDFKDYWKYKKPGSMPIRVLKNGVEKIYSSFAEFACKENLHRCTISKYLNANNTNVYNGYIIEKIVPY